MHCKTYDDGIDGDEDDIRRSNGGNPTRLAFDETQRHESFKSGYVKGLVTGFCIGLVGLLVVILFELLKEMMWKTS